MRSHGVRKLVLIVTSFLAAASCSTQVPVKSQGNLNTTHVNEGGENRVKVQVEDLLKRINENPDLLHRDSTPAVKELIRLGLPSLRYGLLELLLSNDPETRLRAERVLTGVTMAEMGFLLGVGWSKPEQEMKWRRLWKSNGAYDWESSPVSRRSSYAKWQQWVREQK